MKDKRPLLIALLAFAGSVSFMAGGIRTWQLNQAFEASGQRVTGTLDEMRILYGKHTSWLVSYHFATPGGIQSIRSQQIGGRTYGYLSLHGPVPIVYLPEKTAICRIDLPSEEKYQSSERTSIFGTVLFAVVGCIALVSGTAEVKARNNFHPS